MVVFHHKLFFLDIFSNQILNRWEIRNVWWLENFYTQYHYPALVPWKKLR